jgi:hypothetical protein
MVELMKSLAFAGVRDEQKRAWVLVEELPELLIHAAKACEPH